jgi:hypothetical protein
MRSSLFIALLAGLVCATQIERATDTLTLSVERLSTRIWSLSLYCHTVDVKELVPVPRDVLHLGKAHISLSMLGTLMDMRLELDSFELRDMQLSLLRDTNGVLRLFNEAIPDEDIDTIFPDDEEEEASDAMSESNFDVPYALIDGLTITCDDHDSRERLWSLDNARMEVRDWRSPPRKNRDMWTMSLSAGLYTNPASRIEFHSAVVSRPSEPFIHMGLTATYVRVATVEEIIDTASGATEDGNAEQPAPASPPDPDAAKPPSWFDRCFSNEWLRLETAVDEHLDIIASNATVQAFFNDASLSAMSFDLLCDITISNRTILPGSVTFRFHRPPPDPATLVLDYRITNAAQVIIPVDTPHTN